nr:hypothetical protein GCM10010200_015230 [Actinomadura rugatobispora]
MNGIVAAFGATALYYLGFAIFKLAADRIEPLRANRLWHMTWSILTDWVFLAGLVLVLSGLTLQILALAELSLGIAVPIFMSGAVPLLLIALAFFGERLTGREWLSLLMFGAALLLIAASIGNPPPIKAVDVPLWKLAVIVAPALIVPLAIMLTGDHRPDGRHARPITGIAYGLSSGIPIGTAELCIKGWSDSGIGVDSLLTPYPYATVTAAVVGFGVLMAAFQRCRVSVVAVVMTVSAKTHLLVTGTFMYGEPWPQDARYFMMRLGALALAAIALLQFPRHRPLAEPDPGADRRAEDEAPGRDPFGGPATGRTGLGVSSFAQVPGARSGEGPGAEAGTLSAPTPFDRPPGQRPPGRGRPDAGAPGRTPSGQLAPDRGSGPHALGTSAGQGTGEFPMPQDGAPPPEAPPPPVPGPYAQDPLGRGPYRPEVFDDDNAYEIQEQFGGALPHDRPEGGSRRPPGPGGGSRR